MKIKQNVWEFREIRAGLDPTYKRRKFHIFDDDGVCVAEYIRVHICTCRRKSVICIGLKECVGTSAVARHHHTIFQV